MNLKNIKKRYKIISGAILLMIFVLLAAPSIGRWYIVRNSIDLIGRRLDIKKISINYFTGTFRIREIKLYEPDSTTLFVSLNQLRVNLDYFPLFRNEIFVRKISLDDPFIEILQDGDKFNFSDLIVGDTTDFVKDTVPSVPMKYIINNIRINRGTVKYTDIPIKHTIAVDRLDLLIPGFTWNSDSANLDVNFRFVDGGGLNSSLALNQADSTYSINLKLDSLNLDIIEPYFQSKLHISALHGYLSNDITIKGNTRSVMQLIIKGVNHFYGFSMLDTLNRNIISFNDLSIDIDTLRLDKNLVKFNSVIIKDPFILVEMIDSTNNWFALMKQSGSEQTDSLQNKTDSTMVSSGTGSYTFSKLLITGGRVVFTDKTLRYPFEYKIGGLNIESSPVKGKEDNLNMKISAVLNETGTFSMDANFDPSNFRDLDLDLSIGQFRMKDVDAYFRHYFGFPVTGGIMNFKTENKVRQESLTSDNNIYFRKFTLDKAVKGKVEYHIPLRLALGILSDKDGIIDIKAPVESKGEEVKVKNLGRIIFRIIGRLFVKAAVSPFNLLSASYEVDPAELQEIHLDLFDPSPDKDNLKSVDIIADILRNKPGLNIEFFYCINRSEALDSIGHLLAIEDYTEYSKTNGLTIKNVADSTLKKYLLEKLQPVEANTNIEIGKLYRDYFGVEKLGTKLDSIKTLQINFLSDYLIHDKEIPVLRFKINAISPDTIRPSGNYPAFRTFFTAGEQ